MSDSPVIALISATPAAIEPAVQALASAFPAASPWNILDDRLLADAQAQGGVSEQLAQRMNRLISHAVAEGAGAILLTCSLYGDVAHAYENAPVPLLAADDAAFAAVIAGAYRRVLVVASLDSAREDSVERLRAAISASVDAATDVDVTSVVADGALAAANEGDQEALYDRLLDACRTQRDEVDAVLLAQYSLAPVAHRLAETLGVPVISSPDAAAALLRARLSIAS